MVESDIVIGPGPSVADSPSLALWPCYLTTLGFYSYGLLLTCAFPSPLSFALYTHVPLLTVPSFALQALACVQSFFFALRASCCPVTLFPCSKRPFFVFSLSFHIKYILEYYGTNSSDRQLAGNACTHFVYNRLANPRRSINSIETGRLLTCSCRLLGKTRTIRAVLWRDWALIVKCVQGQGRDQPRLADFCQDTTIDIIPIGFITTFPDQQEGNNGYPVANYGNACGSAYWVAPDGTQTKMFTSCYQIAEDIPKCQALGKKILVSLGGDSTINKIASPASAKAFAGFLWGTYGPPQDTTGTLYPRPFGQNVVDGFDLDIETGSGANYANLVNELRTRMIGQPKQYYISAAPQCSIPDPHLAEAIQNSAFDYMYECRLLRRCGRF